MRLLVPGRSGLSALDDLDSSGLFRAYSAPESRWVRCNMVTSLDGAANGPDGRSGSINNQADHVVFEVLRASSHVVVVGAGTIRAEGYPPLSVQDSLVDLRRQHGLPDLLPLVAVSNRGHVPPTLSGCRDGRALIAVPSTAPGLAAARADLGPDHVLVCGDDEVDLAVLVAMLHDRGWDQVLTEGGPGLLGSFLAAGQLDELCYTVVPRVVGGEHPRTVGREALPTDLHLETLVEQDGTIMGRWFVTRPDGSGAQRSQRDSTATTRASPETVSAPPATLSARLDELPQHPLPALRVVVPLPAVTRGLPALEPHEVGASSRERHGRADRHEVVTVRRDDQHRVAQLVRASDPVGAGHVDRLVDPDQAARAARAHQAGRHADERRGHEVKTTVVSQHDTPVDDRRVEHDARDVLGQGRAIEGLQDDGAAHRPPEKDDATRTVRHGIPHGGLDVAPLREPEVVAPVGSP